MQRAPTDGARVGEFLLLGAVFPVEVLREVTRLGEVEEFGVLLIEFGGTRVAEGLLGFVIR